MDASAVGHDYVSTVEKHVSQTDHSHGFGGKFGVQTDRVDKVSSVGHRVIRKSYAKPKRAQYVSQTDNSHGFGRKFGVQTKKVDKVSCEGRNRIEYGFVA